GRFRPCAEADSDEIARCGVRHGGRAAWQGEAGENVGDVAVYAVLAQSEGRRDVAVASPLGDEPEDLGLPRREHALVGRAFVAFAPLDISHERPGASRVEA